MSTAGFVDHLENGDVSVTVRRLPDGSLVHVLTAGAGYLEFPEAQWSQLIELVTAAVTDKKGSAFRSMHGRLFGRKR